MHTAGRAVDVTRRVLTVAFGTGTRVSLTVVRAVAAGEPPTRIVEEIAVETSDRIRQSLAPGPNGRVPARVQVVGGTPSVWSTVPTLPELFAALLDESADVHLVERAHPAYLRLTAELAPDEARILRLLARDGSQPAVDVRTKRPFGVGSTLVGRGITMIGLHAGCARPEQVPSYLNNLFRLGFVWFSRESVADIDGYQVLEAQPEVLDAIHSAKRATTILRSIELTAFGRDFCAECGLTGGLAAAERAAVRLPE
jgi:hypothetical protein